MQERTLAQLVLNVIFWNSQLKWSVISLLSHNITLMCLINMFSGIITNPYCPAGKIKIFTTSILYLHSSCTCLILRNQLKSEFTQHFQKLKVGGRFVIIFVVLIRWFPVLQTVLNTFPVKKIVYQTHGKISINRQLFNWATTKEQSWGRQDFN